MGVRGSVGKMICVTGFTRNSHGEWRYEMEGEKTEVGTFSPRIKSLGVICFTSGRYRNAMLYGMR